MTLLIHDDAKNEITVAQDYLNQRSAGLGRRFIVDLGETLVEIERHRRNGSRRLFSLGYMFARKSSSSQVRPLRDQLRRYFSVIDHSHPSLCRSAVAIATADRKIPDWTPI